MVFIFLNTMLFMKHDKLLYMNIREILKIKKYRFNYNFIFLFYFIFILYFKNHDINPFFKFCVEFYIVIF